MLRHVISGLLIAVFCAIPFTVSAVDDIEAGLWLYLPLNEGQGGEVKDLGPNKFKTEMSKNAPKWVKPKQPKLQNALEFNGKDNYVMIDMAGQKKDIDSHTDEKKGLSICAWVQVIKTGVDAHGQNRQPIVMKGAGGMWEFALYVYDGLEPGMSVWNCGGTGVAEPSGGNLGNDWHYQCGTFAVKEGVKVYIDAAKNPVTQAASNANVPCDGTRPVYLAYREDGQWLNAQIAEVRIWNRVISTAEMKIAMDTIGGLSVEPTGKLTTTWGKIKER
jgi:hypothetical protein